ncbi:MAG: hypothetical protein Q6363_005695 [Candidatus Njordarchaeota archaeon]
MGLWSFRPKIKREMVADLEETLRINGWSLEEYIAGKANSIVRHVREFVEDWNDLPLEYAYSDIVWLFVALELVDVKTDRLKLTSSPH